MRRLVTYLGNKRAILFYSLAGFFAFVAVLYLFFPFRKAKTSPTGSDSAYRLERKVFTQKLRLSGTTGAARSFTVLAPTLEGAQVGGAMIITNLAPTGSQVKKGDVLVEFDPQAQMKDYLDKKSTYDNLVGQVAQKRAGEEIALAKDDTALKQAEDELDRAKLELQRNEIVSRIDAEKNQQAAEEAEATLKQLKVTYELKRSAAKATIRIQEIQRDRAMEAMRYAQNNAAKMTVHSPMNGLVVLNSIWLGGRMGTVQTGDQVRSGVPFMAVVDPSQMEVRVELNQVDLLRVHIGQHAKMHLDAYPGIEFAATLEDLSPLGHRGQFTDTVRTFATRFSIQGADPRLLPDLSAVLDLDLASEQKALAVPRQFVASEANSTFVWVKNGVSFEKRAVRIGATSDDEVVVLSGLQEGDIVQRAKSVQP